VTKCLRYPQRVYIAKADYLSGIYTGFEEVSCGNNHMLVSDEDGNVYSAGSMSEYG
jgi:Alpha-tubulin suppressor and related RCC1 domain-containing proteins